MTPNKRMKLTYFKEAVINGSSLIPLFVFHDLFLCSLVLIFNLGVYHFERLHALTKKVPVTQVSVQDVLFFPASLSAAAVTTDNNELTKGRCY
jgi:hypothetical protein